MFGFGSRGRRGLEELRGELEQVTEENKRLKEELTNQQRENAETLEMLDQQTAELEQVKTDLAEAASSSCVEELTSELQRERERAKSAWRLNCEQVVRCDAELEGEWDSQIEGTSRRQEITTKGREWWG